MTKVGATPHHPSHNPPQGQGSPNASQRLPGQRVSGERASGQRLQELDRRAQPRTQAEAGVAERTGFSVSPAQPVQRGAPTADAQTGRPSGAPSGNAGAKENALYQGLLNLEREARQAASEAELGYLMVNGSRVAVQYRQAILLKRSGKAKHKVTAVSSLSAVDRNSTFVRWIERLCSQKLKGDTLSKVLAFDARAEAAGDDLDASTYPFSQMALIPLQLRDGTVFSHLILTREAPWDEKSLVAAARLCETYSHAYEALTGPKRVKRRLRSRTMLYATAAAVLVGAGFIPVPLSVLAPAQVTALQPFVVAAPIDGTIETVVIDPNARVEKGALLFSYSDTDLRNRVKLAGQAVSVAEARYQQSLRTSFSDPKAKRELSIAQSELQLKAGEYDYARDLLAKTQVKAGASGIVLYDDKDTWTGRPVSTGERIMRIADPARVELTVQLPVSDAIIIEKGARVQLYLDSDPLKAIDATLTAASFHAKPDGAGVLSYRVRAAFTRNGEADAGSKNGAGHLPRIGLRGTAKVFGDDVSLGYYLFRKPLAAVRQWTGY
ncbi:MAG: HlyD family efflux transporter periplasmic adaptor subunit [Pseudomonadota bacterium]